MVEPLLNLYPPSISQAAIAYNSRQRRERKARRPPRVGSAAVKRWEHAWFKHQNSLSLSFFTSQPTYLSFFLPIYRSIHLSIFLVYPSIHLSIDRSIDIIYIDLSINRSIYLPIFLSTYLSFYLPIYPSMCQKIEIRSSKMKKFCDCFHFWNSQRQKRSNSARLPSKKARSVHSSRPRTNAFCGFSTPSG